MFHGIQASVKFVWPKNFCSAAEAAQRTTILFIWLGDVRFRWYGIWFGVENYYVNMYDVWCMS